MCASTQLYPQVLRQTKKLMKNDNDWKYWKNDVGPSVSWSRVTAKYKIVHEIITAVKQEKIKDVTHVNKYTKMESILGKIKNGSMNPAFLIRTK